jgi:hypothetical protein
LAGGTSPTTVIVTTAPADYSGVKPVELDRLAPLQSRVETVHGQYVQAQDASGLHRLLRMNDGAGTANAFLIPFDENFGARLSSVQRLHQRLTANSSTALPSGSQLAHTTRKAGALRARAGWRARRDKSPRNCSGPARPRARNIPAIEWTNAALRKRINRIIVGAKVMRKDGYLKLLRGDVERARRFRRSPSRRLPFPLTVVVNSQDGTPQGQSLRRVSPRAPIVRHARLRSVAVSGSGPNASEAHLGLLPLPVLRRASSELTTLPRSSVCQAGRSKTPLHRHWPGLRKLGGRVVYAIAEDPKPGPPSAHATPRPIPDNSHPRARAFDDAPTRPLKVSRMRRSVDDQQNRTLTRRQVRRSRRATLRLDAVVRLARRDAVRAADRLSHG